MKVIILSKSSYKEKDCIYSAISQEGYLSFMAKGAQDPKSKFVWLNNPLTVADVEFLSDGRYKHKVVNNATLISSPMLGATDYGYLVSIGVLAEITRNVLPDEEKHLAFNDCEAALNALRSGKDHLMVILIYLAKMIKFSGAELEVNQCIHCGARANIIAFSFEDGGFICENCQSEDTVRDLNPAQMKLIRFIFRVKEYGSPNIEKLTDDDKRKVLTKLKEFTDDIVGVRLNSLDTLINAK